MGVDQKQPACLIRPGLLNAGHRIKRQGWEWAVSSGQEDVCLMI